MGGPYNYIGSNFSAFSMFSSTRGIYYHHGRSSIRPLRRGMFRVNTYLHWPEEIPQSASTTGLCPRVDIIPRVVIATDVATGSQKPRTLFVTYAPKLSSETVSGSREDGLGIVYQHAWIVWLGDADGNEVDFPELVGHARETFPRLCGFGLS